MRICAAQTRPITGDVPANIARHLEWVNRAAAAGADFIVFPELSLTGYEPALARNLATSPDDARFDVFQTISDTASFAIAAGMPTRHEDGIRISLLLFRPHQSRHVYSKSYLHADEVPFFVPGRSSPALQINGSHVALAICYELSVSEHLESALKSKPIAYVASVAKFVKGTASAHERLSEIARTGSVPVIMANCTGAADGGQCAGQSAIWDGRGSLLRQLDGLNEGLLIFDTDAHEIVARQ